MWFDVLSWFTAVLVASACFGTGLLVVYTPFPQPFISS